ncbi:MAG: hypothetical protein ABFE07_27785 [Armatimonadia bacterium]
MSKIEDGGPAFPHVAADGHADYRRGMSQRSYIATKVLTGLGDWTPNQDDGSPPDWTSMAALRKRRAEWAVAQADALIAALNSKDG